MRIIRHPLSAIGLFLLSCLATEGNAAETLHIGKASPTAFAFTPIDIGVEKGFFAKQGLTVESVSFGGSAKIHQAMAAGAVDLALGSGPDLAYVEKQAPEIGVAALAGRPLLFGVIVRYDAPFRSADDLKGRKIGVSTNGSLTHWLALELARSRSWGPDGITSVATGGGSGQQSALQTGLVDAVIEASALGFQLEERKAGRLLLPTSDYVSDFLAHVIFASRILVQNNPDAIRRFLRGWFESVAFMRANRDETIRIVRTVTGFDQTVEEREYDLVMPMFSTDGRFETKALDTIRRSLRELGMLDHEPDMRTLYTEQFLPNS